MRFVISRHAHPSYYPHRANFKRVVGISKLAIITRYIYCNPKQIYKQFFSTQELSVLTTKLIRT